MEKCLELIQEADLQDITLPEEISGKVTVVSCIAGSEKQQVYLVKDKKEKPLVLKIAGEEKVNILRRDAAMLKEHSFPFLPGYVSYIEDGKTGYLLREYIAGDTLWERVNKQGVFQIREANTIMCRLCDMTEQFHRRKPAIIHRDIKPQNIVMTEEKDLFMIDMGTARIHKEGSSRDTILIGSRLTAAPEQYGYRQTDARSDIYALGVLYMFLLTGSLNVQELKELDTIPRTVRRIIGKCTRMDPDDRYQSCRRLKRAITAPFFVP